VKVEEIRALSNDEIAKALESAYEEQFNLRFRLATRQLVNHREPGRVRRNVARIKTVMRERELAINEGA